MQTWEVDVQIAAVDCCASVLFTKVSLLAVSGSTLEW